MEAIQGWIDKAGLAETRIERRMMDRSAMAAGRGNWTSAADMEAMLLAIHGGRCVSDAASREMRRALGAQQIQDRLPRHVDAGTGVANKTGNVADVVHDVGILTRSDTTVVIAALTQGVRPAWRAADLIAEVATTLA
jgi:beta-lactamase class A